MVHNTTKKNDAKYSIWVCIILGEGDQIDVEKSLIEGKDNVLMCLHAGSPVMNGSTTHGNLD